MYQDEDSCVVVLSSWCYLYLHGGGCEGGEFLGHALGDAREHGGA